MVTEKIQLIKNFYIGTCGLRDLGALTVGYTFILFFIV